MLVLILRSAHAEENPQSTNERARVSKDEDVRLGSPSCFGTHRSSSSLWNHRCSLGAAMLPSMRARARAAFWKAQWRAKHQPAAVGNDHPLRSIVSRLLFTMRTATLTCRARIRGRGTRATSAATTRPTHPSIVEPGRRQSYVRLFPIPTPSTSLATLEPFAIASRYHRPTRGRGGRSSWHPKGDMHPWPE